ncbi:hypothetical protein [Lysinibacillus sp. 3P01SB]|uniref:hypothetical protein n=1 Tax=Lysinibacillus sp. 3P01SB TaxID=3132284 RepID=UPI0039A697E0
MDFTNKKSYIIIPNVAFGFGTEYHMTTNEFMVFGYLQLAKSIGLENQIVTMIDVIVEALDWNTSNTSRDRSRVQEVLTGLHNKGYITVKFNGTKMVSSVLIITIKKEMEAAEAISKVDWRDRPFIFSGWTRIEYYEYNLAKCNGEHLMIIAYTKWREQLKKAKNITYKIAYQEWQAVLSVSYTKSVDTIKKCATFIEKITGAYYKDEVGQWKQGVNEYSVRHSKPNVKEIEKKEKVRNAQEKFAEKVTDLRYKFEDNILKQINDYGTKWELDGYTAWIVTDCPILKEAGEKKFEILENKGQGWVKEKLEKEYEERKLRREHQQKATENHINDYEPFVSSYKKPKKREGGIKDFLDDAI